MTYFTQTERKSKQKQESLQSKVDEAMTSFTQAELKSQQKQEDLQSKLDHTMNFLAKAEKQCQQKQDDIQSSQSKLYLTITSLLVQIKQVLEVSIFKFSNVYT